MNRFYDTNALLSVLDDAFETRFITASKVLEEIESIKGSTTKDPEVKFKARKLCRLLLKHEGKYSVVIETDELRRKLSDRGLPYSADNIILESAATIPDVVVITDDIACRLIAKNIFGLSVESAQVSKKDEYSGYLNITLSDNELSEFYCNLSDNHFGCLTNQYLILHNKCGDVVEKRRWDGSMFVPLSYRQVQNSYLEKIKPRNLEQELAFDLLQDMSIPIKILHGQVGSGKDYLSITHAMDLVLKKEKFKKILWVRNNIEVKGTRQIGYLPGTKDEKLRPLAAILADHVGGEDHLDNLMARGVVELDHLGQMRGRDIKDTLILCSEMENSSREHLKMLISRLSKGSAIWINGDFKQIDDVNFEYDNGLLAVIERLKGNRLFGCVKLMKTERSEIAALADLLN